MAQPLEIVLILKKPSINDTTTKRLPLQDPSRNRRLFQNCALRLKIVNWLSRAQLKLKTSRSTLFLAISMLDRLVMQNYHLNDETYEVIAGSLMMLASKFNEVNPPSPRKLNQLLTQDLYRSPEDFIEAQGSILQALDFNLSEKFNFYERLALLQNIGIDSQKERRQKVIETVIGNVNLFRFGPEVLLQATERVIRGEEGRPQEAFSEFRQRQITQIQSEVFVQFSAKIKKEASHSH